MSFNPSLPPTVAQQHAEPTWSHPITTQNSMMPSQKPPQSFSATRSRDIHRGAPYRYGYGRIKKNFPYGTATPGYGRVMVSFTVNPKKEQKRRFIFQIQ